MDVLTLALNLWELPGEAGERSGTRATRGNRVGSRMWYGQSGAHRREIASSRASLCAARQYSGTCLALWTNLRSPLPFTPPPPARNSIALCSARSTSSFLQNSSRPFAPLASCKPVISILSSLYADSDYSTDYVVAIRFLFIARETVGINLHVFNTYLLFLSVFFFFFNNVVT